MKLNAKLLIPLLLIGLFTSCFEDGDDNTVTASEINDFVWKGMNAFYLYKSQIPNLANDRFTSNSEYGEYLNSFTQPQNLFESLIHQRETVDKYSWMTDDYIALEQQFSGVSKHNGMEFGLRYVPGSSSEIYGYVRFVLPNTSASNQGLERGQVFYGVDGTNLTIDNYRSLLFSNDSYSINFGNYNTNGTPNDSSDDFIDTTNESMALTKVVYTENPVFKTEILEVNGENVGYLMYNGFVNEFDTQLNNAFGEFTANNVKHLILDLRYNPGGSVNTATLLGSMITGQFNGQVYTKLTYNEDRQENNSTFNFTNTLGDGTALNQLFLDEVFVITTRSSASASEMVINSLKAYTELNVVQIGTNTTGKSQGSITLYDSPNFGRSGANPSHTYAMQPLVAISVNKNDGQVPSTGLVPDIELEENTANLGVLGNPSEPLLDRALMEIENSSRHFNYIAPITLVGDNNSFNRFAKEMYFDNPFIDEE
ncbi:MAG: peptidase S41 [Flavobacteriaceae bacterium]|nr:peptidase S41 [Flavobacteriaceae bacterium]